MEEIIKVNSKIKIVQPTKAIFVIFILENFLKNTVDNKEPQNDITEIKEKNSPTFASDLTIFSTTKGKIVQKPALAKPVVRASQAKSLPKSC